MTWPRFKPGGPVEYWFCEAATQFANGFISGWRGGVGTGAGTGAVTGLNPDIANNITAWQQILISASTTLLAMFFSGMGQVTRWHETNPVPNPFPAPSANPQPPPPTS